MSEPRAGYRRDLELAPGAGFRLRRRFSARAFSLLLAAAAAGWGAFDLFIDRWFVGAATLVLAFAFIGQFVLAELDSWRFEGALLHRSWTGVRLEETRFTIRGVQVTFAAGRARAWVELSDGGEVPLVEGDEGDVRRVAERLAAVSRDERVLH
jgi:hypothetical protein